jgi:hypothetical protein
VDILDILDILERISADQTDAHMNDLVSGCANHASGGGGVRIGTLPCPSRAEATEFVAKVTTHAHMRVAHNAWFSSRDGMKDGISLLAGIFQVIC